MPFLILGLVFIGLMTAAASSSRGATAGAGAPELLGPPAHFIVGERVMSGPDRSEAVVAAAAYGPHGWAYKVAVVGGGSSIVREAQLCRV
jgi:hypothetical protein